LKTVCSCDDVVPFSVLQALQVLPFCCYLILGGVVQISVRSSVCCHGYNTDYNYLLPHSKKVFHFCHIENTVRYRV